MKKLKLIIPILLLFIAIGYATISVTLSINGKTEIVSNSDDFNVYFSKALLNGTEDKSIIDSERSIKFDLTLEEIGEKQEISYDVTNASRYFDAKISLTCTASNEYLEITNTFDTSSNLSALSTRSGNLVLKRLKSNANETDNNYSVECTINASAVERTTIATGEVVGPVKGLISFYVNGNITYAEEGMTWEEWANSLYNTGYASDASSAVINYIDEETGVNVSVSIDDIILEGISYWYEECCFDPGSQVLMADGTTKNIEDVEVGDMIMSLNEDTGEYISQKVTKTIIKENSTDLVYVNLSNGVQIGMRAYHPLLTTEGWKSLRPDNPATIKDVGHVELLKVGDTLVGYEENVTIVSIEEREHIDNYTTYNLSVEGYNNYIVNGIVAHNEVCVS